MRKAGIRDSRERRGAACGGNSCVWGLLFGALVGTLSGGAASRPALAQSSVPTPVLRIEATDVAPQVTLGSTRLFTFTVRNLQNGTDFVYGPRYRLTGTAGNFDGDTRDMLRANFLTSDSVSFQLRAIAVGQARLTLSLDYVECAGGGTACMARTVSESFSVEVVPVVLASLTPTPTPTRSPTNAAGASPSATATAVVGLTISLAVFPQNPVVGDNVSFVFTVSNLQPGVVARRPIYRLSGLPPNFDGDMSNITHEVDITGPQTDTVQFNFRAVNPGVTQLRMQVDYLECRGTTCRGGFSQTPVYSIVTRGSQQTPIAESTTTPTSTAPATPTLTPTFAVGTGLTIETEVIGSAVVGGDQVLFVFQVYNRQAGITAQSPTYLIVGTGGLFAGDTTPISRDTILSAQQPDTVIFRLTPIASGVAPVRLQVNYEECRGAQCTAATTISTAVPVQVRATSVVPTSTPSATPTAPPPASATATPTLTAIPSLTFTPTRTTIPSATATRSPAFSPTRTATATTVATPLVMFDVVIDPPQPVVGQNVTVTYTIRNLQGPTTLRRQGYVISGVSPNLDGNIDRVEHDVPILGSQVDTVVYRLRAVNEGTSLLQIHLTYEACGATLPCAFGAASSVITPVNIIGNVPTATPTLPGAVTATPTATVSPPTQATPVLVYSLEVNPQQPFVGDVVDLVFSVRNIQGGTQAVRPSYHVTGTSPNFEDPIPGTSHDVAIGGTFVDMVRYRLGALHEGTSLLQIHSTYDICNTGAEPCSFGNSSSQIFRVVVRDPPTPTPTVTATSTATASFTPTPTQTPNGSETITPTPTETIIPRIIVADDDCSLQPQRLGRRGGWLPIWMGGVVLVWWRSRAR